MRKSITWVDSTCPLFYLFLMDHAKGHPGFKAVQRKIAKRMGVSEKRAGAILAASTRKASAKAKRANPRLKRVKGA